MNSIIGTVKNGKVIYDKGLMQVIIAPLEGSRIEITIKKFSGKKTISQLGYIFGGIVGHAAKEYGCLPQEMYSLLMSECNKKPVVNKKTGEIAYVPFGLSSNDKFETAQVIDRAIRYLAENGICVETPDEYLQRRKIMDELETSKEN